MQNLVLLETNKTIATSETARYSRYWSDVGYVSAARKDLRFEAVKYANTNWATKLIAIYDLHLTPWKTYLL